MRDFSASRTLPSIQSHRLFARCRSQRETVFDHAEYLIIMDTLANTTSHLIVTEAEFSRWLAAAEAGAVRHYHEGFLVLDCARGSTRLSAVERKELAAVARLAWWASEQRVVHLVQRRLGPNRFAYLAIMRKTTPKLSPRGRHARPAE
jgi:hypothetical protein